MGLIRAAVILVMVAACGGTRPTESVVSNHTGAAAVSAPDAGAVVSCDVECIDEVGCLLAERPPACCQKYRKPCKVEREP